MNLFHPDRPKMGTRPKVLGQEFVVPNLNIQPISETHVKVYISLPSIHNGFTDHHCILPLIEINEFILQYIAAPELIFQADFKWQKTEAVFIDEHFSTLEQREEFYKSNPEAGLYTARAKPKPTAPSLPPGYALPQLPDDF